MTLETLINKIKSKYDSWDSETKEIFDESWKRMEGAETDVEVFELRLKKQWSKGSNLYTEKEVEKIAELSNIQGLTTVA
jgi:hypothetical protein